MYVYVTPDRYPGATVVFDVEREWPSIRYTSLDGIRRAFDPLKISMNTNRLYCCRHESVYRIAAAYCGLSPLLSPPPETHWVGFRGIIRPVSLAYLWYVI